MIFADLEATGRRHASCAALLSICLASAPAMLRAQWLPSGATSGPIYYNGSVGIGTASPGQELEVADTNAIKLGAAYMSSGIPSANHAVFASNAMYNGSGWVIPNATTIPQALQFYGGGTYFLQAQTPGAANWQYRLAIASNGYVGIGMASPGQELEVADTNAIKLGAAYMSSGIPSANHAVFASNAMYNGSGWVIPNATATAQMLQFYGGATYFLQTQTPGVADWQYRFAIASNGYVGIGTTNPTNALSVNGTVQAKEVLVNTGWSDYVFAPTYHLRPLTEVAAYIEQNHHLPDIPSAAEVKEKGVSVGEMESKLLAKIEELTLHMIQADEQIRGLKEENRKLENQIKVITAEGSPK